MITLPSHNPWRGPVDLHPPTWIGIQPMCQDPSTWILHARLPPRGPNAGRGWASRGLSKAEALEKVKVGRAGGQCPWGQQGGQGLEGASTEEWEAGSDGI